MCLKSDFDAAVLETLVEPTMRAYRGRCLSILLLFTIPALTYPVPLTGIIPAGRRLEVHYGLEARLKLLFSELLE